MDRTITEGCEQYFTVVLFVFQFYPVSNFGTYINFRLGTFMSEWVNYWKESFWVVLPYVFVRLLKLHSGVYESLNCDHCKNINRVILSNETLWFTTPPVSLPLWCGKFTLFQSHD